MHRRAGPSPSAASASTRGGASLRLSIVAYALIAIFIGYNAFITTATSEAAPLAKRADHVVPGQFGLKQSKPTANIELFQHEPEAEEKPTAAAHANDERHASENTPQSTWPTASCFRVHEGTCEFTKQMCKRFIQHAAPLLGSSVQALCSGADGESRGDCVAAVQNAMQHAGHPIKAEMPTEWLSRWAKARAKPAPNAPGAVMAKYHPALWHNLISWSPQLTAAAFGTDDPMTERLKWRHGKREPGHFAEQKEPLIPRTQEQRAGVCADLVDPMKFLPFSGAMRAVFECELALSEMTRPSSSSGEFEPLTSFHTVWGFPEPRKCALDALKGKTHPAISSPHVRAWEGGQWKGYIDNTTGITEFARAWRNIVTMATKGKASPRSWVDFLWTDLPEKSVASARHILRAFSEYNAWLAHNAFAACAPALAGLIDQPVIEYTAAKGAIIGLPPPALGTMQLVADCSGRVLGTDASKCQPHVKSGVETFKAGEASPHPFDDKVVGLLPSLACIHVLGLRLRVAESSTAELADYHRLAMNYARGSVGSCSRSLVYVRIVTTPGVLKQAEDGSTNPPRDQSPFKDQSTKQADNVLRLFNVDIVRDFPLVDLANDIRMSVEGSENTDAMDANVAVNAAYDYAWHFALKALFVSQDAQAFTHRLMVSRGQQYADGVPRLQTQKDKHMFIDFLAVIPAYVTFVPTNFLRFTTRRDLIATGNVMRIPRLIAHPDVATETANEAQRFFVMDAHMITTLKSVLFTPSCPLTAQRPALDFWRCIANLRLRVTDPTEDSMKLVVNAQSDTDGTRVSPYAFTVLGFTPLQSAQFWSLG
jgi:hypothetical protein